MPVGCTAYLMPSGGFFAFHFDDGGSPAHDTLVTAVTATDADLPTYRVNGGSPVQLLRSDIHWYLNVHQMPTVVFKPVMTSLLSTDVVTVTTVAGWVTTAAGPAPAITDGPVTNLVGGSLLPDPLDPTPTMHVGSNAAFVGDQVNLMVCNRFCMSTLSAAPSGPGPGSFNVSLNSSWQSYGSNTKYWPTIPNRRWCLAWDGVGDIVADPAGFGDPFYGTCVEDVPARRITGAANNRRFYTTGGTPGGTSGSWGCFVLLIFFGISDGAGGHFFDQSNLRWIPDDVDLDDPPLLDPGWVTKARGLQCIRYMDMLAAIAGNGTDYSDYSTPRPYGSPGPRTLTATVAEIRQYVYDPADFPADFLNDGGTALKVTTASAHPFSPRQWLTLSTPGVSLHYGSGATPSLDGAIGFIYPLTSTTFVIYITRDIYRTGTAMTDVIANPGTVSASVAVTPPISLLVAGCNAAGCDLWWCTAGCSTNPCLTSVTTEIAGSLDPGLKLYVEISNETWNGTLAGDAEPAALFGPSSHIYAGDGSNGNDQPFKVLLGITQHTVMRDAWIAAGRDPDDFVRVHGSQHGGPGQHTFNISASLVRLGGTVEAIATAPYWQSNQPSFARGATWQTAFPDVTDRINRDPEAALDYLEIHRIWGGYELEYPLHVQKLAEGGYTGPIDFISYEGGPDNVMLQGGVDGSYTADSTHAIVRHPRFYRIYQHTLRVYQDSGCKLLNDFQMGGIDQPANPWPKYIGSAQLPYHPGDPAQDAIQVNTPNDLDAIQSIVGGALLDWGNAVAGTITPDFSLTVTGSGSLTQGSSITRTVTLGVIDVYAGTAALTIGALPSGVTGVFSPTSLTGGGTVTSTLTLSATLSATTGTTTATVTGTDTPNSLVHSRTFSLTVLSSSPPPPPSSAPSRPRRRGPLAKWRATR